MKPSEKTIYEEIKGTTNEIISQIRRLVREGNARRLIIKNKHDQIVFQSQLTVGVAGTAVAAAVAPVISAILMFLLFVNDAKVLVEKEVDEEAVRDENEIDADIIDISDEDDEDGDSTGEAGAETVPDPGDKG